MTLARLCGGGGRGGVGFLSPKTRLRQLKPTDALSSSSSSSSWGDQGSGRDPLLGHTVPADPRPGLEPSCGSHCELTPVTQNVQLQVLLYSSILVWQTREVPYSMVGTVLDTLMLVPELKDSMVTG